MKRKKITSFEQISPVQKAIWMQRSADAVRSGRMMLGDQGDLPENVAIEHISRAQMLSGLAKASASDILRPSADIERLSVLISQELDKAIAALRSRPPLFTPPPAVAKRAPGRKRRKG